MKTLWENLAKLDIFGVPFSFKFNKKESYSTSLGGLFIILFTILSLYLGISHLIAFVQRDNFAIIYYTMNIPITEQIVFKESQAAIAFGFDCQKNGRFQVDDVLGINVTFVTYSKTLQGEYVKDIKTLSTHKCKHEDFYSLYNDQFDYLSLPKYNCLDDNTQIIQGIWDDQVFTYYEISVISKENTTENLNNIEEYLFQNDCKLQFFYTDITIDLYNYKEPIAPYLNAVFIQLNPTIFIKRNIYFMNQYIMDDDHMLGVFKDYKQNIIKKTLFSRYEEYFLYLGLNKSLTNPPNIQNYAKIYIRADTKKTDIRRNYQKLMEFYANATSLLIGIFRVLVIVFNFIDGFYAENLLTKKIFFLKDFEDNNHFDIFKKSKQIKELISLTDLSEDETSELNSFETNLKDFRIFNNQFNNLDSKTYNNKNQKYVEMKNRIKINSFSFLRDKNDSEMKGIKSIISRNSSDLPSKNEKDEVKNNNVQSKIIKNENFEDTKNQHLEYTFNVFEIIISSFCKCFISKKLAIKKKIKDKSNEIIYTKLDINTYIKNMIFIDIINETILTKNKRDIINLMARPILSTNKEEKYELSKFYEFYTENDFNKFYEKISELMQKTDKKEKEKNLINLVNKNLKEFIN